MQEAGLGDCLLQELVTNAVTHGSPSGYVALRASPGLRRRDTTKYETTKRLRTRTGLGDWDTYFRRHPDDAYFELVVVDRGSGIADTIRQDDRRPDELRAPPKSIDDVHALVRYALETESSRFSVEERRARDLTRFTGLAAVVSILEAHHGALLVRERSSRHVFAHTNRWKGRCFGEHTRLKRPLATIPGVSVTAVVPMQHMYHRRPPFESLVGAEQLTPCDMAISESVSVFRVRRVGSAKGVTMLDEQCGETWTAIAEKVTQLEPSSRAAVVDLAAASVEKNDLWLGMTRVYQASIQRGVPLVLCGLGFRHVRRLQEYIELDKKQIAGGKDWFVIGWGDDSAVYLLGCFGANAAHSMPLAGSIANGFRSGRPLDSNLRIEPPISTYIAWRTPPGSDEGLPYLVATLGCLREAVRRSQATAVQKRIRTSPAWVSDSVICRSDGDTVTSYLCIHSVTQLRDLSPDISRLVQLLASPFAFDFVLAVGIGCREAALAIGRELPHRLGEGRADYSVHWYAYHDYFSLRHGEADEPSALPGSRVLLIIDGIRKGYHAREVISHVRDCGAVPVALIAVFDLSENGDWSECDGVPVRCALRLPVVSAPTVETPAYIESPFTHTLHSYQDEAPDRWNVLLTRSQAYRSIEHYELVLSDHKTFLDQHFARTISLPYLLSSSTALSAELIANVCQLIVDEGVDCIMLPDESSVELLVERVLGSLAHGGAQNRNVPASHLAGFNTGLRTRLGR